MAQVEYTGAVDHANALMEAIHAKIRETLPHVAEALQNDAASRAPTVDEEYKALMVGDHDDGDFTPRAGDRSADTDARIRLQKPVNTYIENTMRSPENVFVDEPGMRCGIGKTLWLSYNSYFEYHNQITENGQPVTGPAIFKGPYFSAFENGSAAWVAPRWRRLKDGGFYPLRPSEERKEARMDKSIDPPIAARRMFFRDFLETVARITLTTALAALGPGRETNTH